MRLTVEHARRAPQFTNALLQREIDFRGLGISALDEHALVLLENKFDVLNLTSNALTCLEYFPLRSLSSQKNIRMDRVVTLIVHQNQLQKVSVPSCVLALPSIRGFHADGNNFASVQSLLFLKYWKKLETVSMEMNPVMERNAEQFDYRKVRAFLVHMCPHLKLIDNERVTLRDRELAASFSSEFKALIARWEVPNGAQTAASTGKKIRKRGRDAPPPSTTAHTTSAEVYGEASVMTAADMNGSSSTIDDIEQSLQDRLAELEERIMADDVTADEIVDIEHKMNALTAEMEQIRKKRRKN